MDQVDSNGRPITDDRKGSLTLRSNHCNYSRAILTSQWHEARQAEPKDYDLNKDPIRSMTLSTYTRIGNITDGSLPLTTYQEQANQIFLKPKYVYQDYHRGLVQKETVASANAGIDRDTGDPTGEFGAVLPFHSPDHNKFLSETTYKADYVAPYPFVPQPEGVNFWVIEEPPDRSAAYKKMKSQFTDAADYRRNGWNTWQDESGIYANSHHKFQVFPRTETIPERPIPKPQGFRKT